VEEMWRRVWRRKCGGGSVEEEEEVWRRVWRRRVCVSACTSLSSHLCIDVTPYTTNHLDPV